MRRLVVTSLVLAAVASIAPPAAAAALFTDPEGDVAAEGGASGALTQLPTGAGPAGGPADLLALDAAESDDAWTFALKVADLSSPIYAVEYGIEFAWMDATYRVLAFRAQLPGADAFSSSSLQLADGDDWSDVADLEHAMDVASGTITTTVPKVLITSIEGHAPTLRSALTRVRVTSLEEIDFGVATARVSDVMPDSGEGTLVYAKGGEAAGHLLFEAGDPVRVSNGGATTFVFQAHLQNAGAVEDTVRLSTENLPEGWTAKVTPVQAVPAEGERPVFVLVTVPFAHEHGGFSSFDLVAKSERDAAAYAKQRFGVLHTPVPMPAGHHPDVYLHAEALNTGVVGQAFPFTEPSMNTIADHAQDAPEAYPNDFSNGVGWRIPLGPQLAMGLDFEVNRTGTIAGALLGRTAGAGTLTAVLEIVKGEDTLATLAEAAAVDLELDPQAATPFSLALAPTPDADYVPYAPGQNLVLTVTLTSEAGAPCCLPQATPTIPVEGFVMSLPVNEYHDVPQFEEGEESVVRLDAEGPVERVARPANTVTYTFMLTNAGASDETFTLEAAGSDAQHAVVAPDNPITLAPGESRRVTLALKLPADANEGQRFEALLLARAARDPSQLAIGRTSTLASAEATTADEEDLLRAAQGGDEKRTPPPLTVSVVLAALAGARLLARRRA